MSKFEKQNYTYLIMFDFPSRFIFIFIMSINSPMLAVSGHAHRCRVSRRIRLANVLTGFVVGVSHCSAVVARLNLSLGKILPAVLKLNGKMREGREIRVIFYEGRSAS